MRFNSRQGGRLELHADERRTMEKAKALADAIWQHGDHEERPAAEGMRDSIAALAHLYTDIPVEVPIERPF